MGKNALLLTLAAAPAIVAMWLWATAPFKPAVVTPRPLAHLAAVPELAFRAITSEKTWAASTKNFLGRPWIADFIFTRCNGPCPMLSANMARLQNKIHPHVRLVSFTVDPDFDDENALREYAQRFRAQPKRWLFARAPKKTLHGFINKGLRLGFAEDDKIKPPNFRITHTSKFVLIDAQGHVYGYYDGNDADSLKALLNDSAVLSGRSRP